MQSSSWNCIIHSVNIIIIASVAGLVNAIIDDIDVALVDKWQQLGIELGLDYTDIKMIRQQFRPEEYIQRMVERWFDKEEYCTWEKFNIARDKVVNGNRRGPGPGVQQSTFRVLHSPTAPADEIGKGIKLLA